jgi:proline dehydrogenase
VNKTARITIELSGRTLENLISLARKLHRHPDDLTVDLLYAAIEASADSTEAQMALMAQSSGGLLQ